jgi:hypothetical protein
LYWAVPISNLQRDTDCPKVFLGFPHFLLVNCWRASHNRE